MRGVPSNTHRILYGPHTHDLPMVRGSKKQKTPSGHTKMPGKKAYHVHAYIIYVTGLKGVPHNKKHRSAEGGLAKMPLT